MKNLICKIVIVPLLTCLLVNTASAAQVFGRLTYVGTRNEVNTNGVFEATFLVRLTDSRCDGSTPAAARYILVKSGRMDGQFAHNKANFRNAYSTALAAFLSGKYIELHGVPSCDANTTAVVTLWNSTFGIFE